MTDQHREALQRQAFGPAPRGADEDDDGASLSCDDPRAPAGGGGAIVIPCGVAIVLVAMVAWSILKSVEYQDVFSSSARYRTALVVANATLLILGTLVVHQSAHRSWFG